MGLFTVISSFDVKAAPCWGPNCNTGISFKETFSQGARNTVSVSQTVSSSPSSTIIRTYTNTPATKNSASIFSKEYHGFMSGTILDDTSDCSNRGRAILEDGPCMKACPGKCDKPNYAPCDEAPCCDQPCAPAPAPCMAAPCLPAPQPCMAPPCQAITNSVKYVEPMAPSRCGNFAPIDLQWVDFRIQEEGKTNYSKKLGNYRFRIFECRRPTKNIMLNQGRTLQKDMRLIEVFKNSVDECINVIKVPTDICLNQKAPLPDYVLTAEIIDFHMNVCDEFDYNNVKYKNSRKGSSEITVVWRLMDLTKTNVLWKGITDGYGELNFGDPYGENTLIEKAFADASNNLRQDPGFESMISRRLDPQLKNMQRRSLIDTQRIIDPVKCQYSEELAAIRAGQKDARSTFEQQSVRKDGSKIYVTEDGTKIFRDKTGRIISVTRNGQTYPIDPKSLVRNSDGTRTITASDGTKIFIDKNDNIVGIECGENPPVIIEDVEVIEPVAIIEKVTVKQPVAVIEKVTTTPPIIEETIEVVERDGIDELFDVTLIEEDITVTTDSRICIYERNAYDQLTPEAMNTIKSALVMVTNQDGKKGSGLLVSEELVITSANMILKDHNTYTIRTTDGRELKAKAFRINVKKNIALLLLEQPTSYNKLAISLDLPKIGKTELISLGILPAGIDYSADKNITEAKGKTLGYRYSDNVGTEILVDTFIQGTTEGGAVLDESGRYQGMSISGKRLGDGPDIFIPLETVLQAVGLEICGREFEGVSGLSKLIEEPISKAPEKMPKKDRK